LFEKNISDNDINSPEKNLNLLCGLMIEAANTDGNLDKVEIDKIKLILINSFGEDPNQVEKVLKESLLNKDNSNSLFYYTSKLNKQFSYDKKILLIETLWEIILSDGEIHDYESNLIRRLGGLLYVSDIDSGNARKRALNKIQN
tara:strand:- start:61 stop:492 length:432 start_codon:yes stop_codon:yes gene_type:complete